MHVYECCACTHQAAVQLIIASIGLHGPKTELSTSHQIKMLSPLRVAYFVAVQVPDRAFARDFLLLGKLLLGAAWLSTNV